MLKIDWFISGYVWETQVSSSCATVAPSMGLHAARDADLQLESALNRMAVEIVAS